MCKNFLVLYIILEMHYFIIISPAHYGHGQLLSQALMVERDYKNRI